MAPQLRVAVLRRAIPGTAPASPVVAAAGVALTGVVDTVDAVLALDESALPDVVVVDGDGGAGTGLAAFGATRAGLRAAEDLLRRRPATRVLLLVPADDDPDLAAAALAAGVVAVIPRDAPADELLAALTAAARGDGYVHTAISRELLSRIGPTSAGEGFADRLTEREREVLELLAGGRSTRQISDALFVGDETVKTHLGHIYRKLGVTDRVQAVALALRRGIVR